MAATIKFADNILKTFATSISIVLSCLLSYAVLGDLNLAPTFILGTVIIISATALYATASMAPTLGNNVAETDAFNKTIR